MPFDRRCCSMPSNIPLSNDLLDGMNVTPTAVHIPLGEITDDIHFMVNPVSITPDSPLSIRDNIPGIINPANYQSPKINPDGSGKGDSKCSFDDSECIKRYKMQKF